MRRPADPAARRRALGELLLERYGIVTREQVLSDGIPGGISAVYDSLAALETPGVARRRDPRRDSRRAQLALPGAAERPRAPRVEADRASPSLPAVGPAQPVLVSIFLPGGADSLSVLYPDGDPAYRKLRPRLALPSSAGPAFTEDERLRWHPSLEPLARLHGEGKVSVLPAVGYAHPDQSHFTSRHFWEVGATEANLRTGWLGRYLDLGGAPDNPLQGLSLD